ncbi:MAG: hypothetical protein ACHP7J_00140 [Terriglobales bacterium]
MKYVYTFPVTIDTCKAVPSVGDMMWTGTVFATLIGQVRAGATGAAIGVKMKAKPCRKCGGTDLSIWDCGYSSFNVGGVKCKKCGHEVKVSPCGCDPKEELIKAWNADKLSKVEAAIGEIEDIICSRLCERSDGDSPKTRTLNRIAGVIRRHFAGEKNR